MFPRALITALGRSSKSCTRSLSSPSQPFFHTSHQQEIVTVLRLNNLRDNPGAVKEKKRVGRGIGSGRGKTCGRGHKGQKARSGGSINPMFEGGQTKLYKRLPKRGFTNVRHAEPMLPLNLGTIQDYIDMGRLDASKTLTIKDLVVAGITKASSIKHGIKLLAKGKERLKSPIKLEISRASESAIEALEDAGGEITTVHYNRLALRALLKPEKFDIIPKQARPPPKLLPYYTSWKHRGYLSLQAQMRHLIKERPDLPIGDTISSLMQHSSKTSSEDSDAKANDKD